MWSERVRKGLAVQGQLPMDQDKELYCLIWTLVSPPARAAAHYVNPHTDPGSPSLHQLLSHLNPSSKSEAKKSVSLRKSWHTHYVI